MHVKIVFPRNFDSSFWKKSYMSCMKLKYGTVPDCDFVWKGILLWIQYR